MNDRVRHQLAHEQLEVAWCRRRRPANDRLGGESSGESCPGKVRFDERLRRREVLDRPDASHEDGDVVGDPEGQSSETRAAGRPSMSPAPSLSDLAARSIRSSVSPARVSTSPSV